MARTHSPPPTAITIRLPPAQVAWIDARANGICSRAAVIRKVIDDAMHRSHPHP